MTFQDAEKDIIRQLGLVFKPGESASMADWLLENISGQKRAERRNNRQTGLSEEQALRINDSIVRLLAGEPIQYVLNEAWFSGLKFFVDPRVLIPRPETEELVEWIISHCKFPVDSLQILDIGTGSGCISIALKRRIRKAGVWACDISASALEVAKKNAETLGTPIHFILLDFLDPVARALLPEFDIIVSNPPYVPEKDKGGMQANVLDHEPARALFVPDEDPMIFYREIAVFGKTHLKSGASIYSEIHEGFGKDAIRIFETAGFTCELKMDMQGKDRMIRAVVA